MRVAITHMSAVSAAGHDVNALAQAAASGKPLCAPSTVLSKDFGEVMGAEVPLLDKERDPVEKKARRTMSYAAYLSCVAMADIVRALPTSLLPELGSYMGVGASGAPLRHIEPAMRVSIDENGFDYAKFTARGIKSVNPLHTFQVLPNFTLCHGAIRHGIQGPNASFYSRGAGTVMAIAEAAHAVQGGRTRAALAGGADTAHHAVTWHEALRYRWAERGFVPGEGAALVCFEAEPEKVYGYLCGHGVWSARRGWSAAIETWLATEPPPPDLIVSTAWGDPARDALRDVAGKGTRHIDLGALLGDALAASPALALVAAMSSLRPGQSAWVLSAGLDQQLGYLRVEREHG